MITRTIQEAIKKDLFKGKVILLLGARQVGKTTLVKTIATDLELEYLWLSGDEPDTRARLSAITSTELKQLYGHSRLVIIDEAQRIENIGLTLKLSIDHFPDVQIIATGSSAFELTNKINEPLTGRKYEYQLYPISFEELKNHTSEKEESRLLATRLIYGSYPAVLNDIGEELRTLGLLTDSYLYRDLYTYEGIKKSSLFENLLKALALQIGNEVSYNELANLLGVNKATVEKYIDLLEKTFVIFRLSSLSRNVRNELKKSKKIYFYDNGIRNAIINNFQSIETRSDLGALWENYLIAERKKYIDYHRLYRHRYFWRTTQQQELDYLEEYDGAIDAYEFKWKSERNIKFSKTFLDHYDVRSKEVIDSRNYIQFLS